MRSILIHHHHHRRYIERERERVVTVLKKDYFLLIDENMIGQKGAPNRSRLMLSFAVAMPYWHWCVLPISAAAAKLTAQQQ